MAENEHDKPAPSVRVEGAHAARKVDHTEDAHDHLKDLNKAIVDDARAVLKEHAENLKGTDGPADNVTGSTASSKEDLLGLTPDPYARAFPPGPDDPYADDDE